MRLTCNEEIGSSILSGGTMKKVTEPKANTSAPKWGTTLTNQQLLDLLDRLETKKKARKDKD